MGLHLEYLSVINRLVGEMEAIKAAPSCIDFNFSSRKKHVRSIFDPEMPGYLVFTQINI